MFVVLQYRCTQGCVLGQGVWNSRALMKVQRFLPEVWVRPVIVSPSWGHPGECILPLALPWDWKCLFSDQTWPTLFSKWCFLVHVQVCKRKSMHLLNYEESGIWGLVIIRNGSVLELVHPNLHWKSDKMKMGPFTALNGNWYQRVNFSQPASYCCYIHSDSKVS